MKSLIEQNLAKAIELQEDKQWACQMFINQCFNLNYQFRIVEAGRTQDRQNRYFLVARDSVEDMWQDYQDGEITLQDARRGVELLKTVKPWVYSEYPITWTLNSNHTKGLAIDIQPLNCKHSDIQPIATLYGITHPLLKDPPHYELTNALSRPIPNIPHSAAAAARKLERQIATATPKSKADRLKARLRSL